MLERIRLAAIAAIMISVTVASTQLYGDVLFVNAALATGADDGSSWSDAFQGPEGLQAALGAAQAEDQIWVAFGAYTPTNGSDTGISFVMKPDVAIYGGFSGVETDPAQRPGDPVPSVANPATDSILSGDLTGNDDYGADFPNGATFIDNSYHVVKGNDVGPSAILDGFTIRGGNAVGMVEEARGGGLTNESGSPKVRHCVFMQNFSLSGGGAVSNYGASSPRVSDCYFLSNQSNDDGGGMFNYSGSANPIVERCEFNQNVGNLTDGTGGGGAMANHDSAPRVIECTFLGNQDITAGQGAGIYNQDAAPLLTACSFSGNTTSRGGAVFNSASDASIVRCDFDGNSASEFGGAVYNLNSSPSLINCAFRVNTATDEGGGIFDSGSDAVLVNCEFKGNGATFGGALMVQASSNAALTNCTLSGNRAFTNGGGIFVDDTSSGVLTNCIVWGNVDAITGVGMSYSYHVDESAQIHVNAGNLVTLNFCDVQQLSNPSDSSPPLVEPGEIGNIGGDVGAHNPDFVQDVGPGGNGEWGDMDDVLGDLHLTASSPCIDKALNDADTDPSAAGSQSIPGVDLDLNHRRFNDTNVPDCSQQGMTSDCGSEPVVDMGAYEFGSSPISATLYVDAEASGKETGTDDFVNAFVDLQDALLTARASAGAVTEIWIAKGIYMPDGGVARNNGQLIRIRPGSGDRTASFVLPAGVQILGGFPTGGGTRDPDVNEVVLSGDLAIDDDSDPVGSSYAGYTENSLHVVSGDGVYPVTTLDGLSIVAGHADGADALPAGAGIRVGAGNVDLVDCSIRYNLAQSSAGGAQFHNGSRGNIVDCVFVGNRASTNGGGALLASNVSVTDCRFVNNSTGLDGGAIQFAGNPSLVLRSSFSGNSAGDGGAIYFAGDSSLVQESTFSGNNAQNGGALAVMLGRPVVSQCVLVANQASNVGGAIYLINDSAIDVERCQVAGNQSSSHGAGVYVAAGGDCDLVNNEIVGNSSSGNGGGIFTDTAAVLLLNTTVAGNHASTGGGATINANGSVLTVTNSIIWGNTSDVVPTSIHQVNGGIAVVDHSDVESGFPGANNIDANPLFQRTLTGVWTAAAEYHPETDETEFVHSLAGIADGELVGLALNPDNSQVLQSIVTANTGTTLRVVGNLASLVDGVGPLPTFVVTDYRLGNVSPCIDRGDDAAYLAALPDGAEDLAGDPRIVCAIDMGAYESQRTPLTQAVAYVDAEATGADDGTSWADAFVSLKSALRAAQCSGSLVTEIWVANGTYCPDGRVVRASDGVVVLMGSGDPNETFPLIDGVSIYGGFAGGETSVAHRPADSDELTIDPMVDSVLSGDLLGDDIYPAEFPNGPSFADNTYNVVVGDGVGVAATLDRFAITAANAIGDNGGTPRSRGGGLRNENGSPVVTDCLFIRNYSLSGGSGISNRDGASPMIQDCRFIENDSNDDGGAINNWGMGTNPRIARCLFSGNMSNRTDGSGGGGAIAGQDFSSASIEDCRFVGNESHSGTFGGAIHFAGSAADLVRCRFQNNRAIAGGGVFSSGNLTVSHSTFSQNGANPGGGGAALRNQGTASVTECSFLENLADGDGAAILNDGASGQIEISMSVFRGNQTVATGDGAAISTNSSNAGIYGCTFVGNTSISLGGAINFKNNANVTVRDSRFLGNHADGHGGAIRQYPSAGTLDLWDCEFIANDAGLNGGAAWLAGASANFTRCSFEINETATNGGAIYKSNPSAVVLSSCEFLGNRALSGGGILTTGSGNVQLINALFAGNTGMNQGGAIFANASSSVDVVNCTFGDHSANINGGCLWLEDTGGAPSATISNSILWNTSLSNPTPQIGTFGAVPVTVTFTDVRGGFAGTGNIDADPLFNHGPNGTWTDDAVPGPLAHQTTLIDANGGFADGELVGRLIQPNTTSVDLTRIVSNTATEIVVWGDFVSAGATGEMYTLKYHRVMTGSPVRDAGSDALVPVGVDTDLEGAKRFQDGDGDMGLVPTVDMGCYEHFRDCNDNGVPDNDEVPSMTTGTYIVSTWTGAGDGIRWSDPQNWCPILEPDNNNGQLVFGVDLSGGSTVVTLNVNPGLDALNIQEGATLQVSASSGAAPFERFLSSLTPISNSGLIAAFDGYSFLLSSADVVQSPSGVLRATGVGSKVQIIGQSVQGGRVEGVDGGRVELLTNGVLTTLTANGVTVPNSNAGFLSGVITNEGEIIVEGVFSVLASGALDAELTGIGGEVRLTSQGNAVLGSFDEEYMLKNATDHTICGEGRIVGAFENEGVVVADSENGALRILDGSKTNSGSFRAIQGGTLNIESLVIGLGSYVVDEGFMNISAGITDSQAGPGFLMSCQGGTINIENGSTVDGCGPIIVFPKAGAANLPGAIFVNGGTLENSSSWLIGDDQVGPGLTASMTLMGNSAMGVVNGPVTVRQNGSLIINGANLEAMDLILEDDASLFVGSSISLAGSLINEVVIGTEASSSSDGWSWEAGSDLILSGGQEASMEPCILTGWATLEAASEDVGASAPSDFGLANIRLAANAHVSLVDSRSNHSDAVDEAVYCESLILDPGAVLNLNGVKLYVGTMQVMEGAYGGQVVNDSRTPTLGDSNGDAVVTVDDAGLFAAALVAPSTDSACFADINGDGFVDGLDIQGFVDLILSP